MPSGNDIPPGNSDKTGDALHSEPRHVCHCGKGFLRKEHLRRHQATHDKHNHICHVCQRSFSRSDLLRRHLSRHETTATPSTRTAKACDACHVSKSKCSGAPPCLLCVKKGINCSFGSTKGTASTKIVEEAYGTPRSSTLTTSPGERSSAESPRDKQGASPIYTAFLRTLSIKPTLPDHGLQNGSRPDTTQRYHHKENFSPQDGLSVLYQSLKSRAIIRLEQMPEPSVEFGIWVSTCCSSYFNQFHFYWPILHRPTFDEQQDPLIVSATVALIGAWLQKSEDATPLILKLHKLLVDQLYEQMCKPEGSSQDQPWPVDLCRAILLNIIFALYTKDRCIISRARLLCSLFVSLLREIGVFSSDALALQARTHFPGTFLPYVQQARERWVRIVSCLLKADTYMSLLRCQPPGLYWEELSVSLPQTFALNNAEGLDVYYRRLPHEPADRPDYKTLALANISLQCAPPMLLIEDIQLGLCELYQTVWKCGRLGHDDAINIHATTNMSESLSSQLDSWKIKLDNLVVLCTTQASHDSNELPLRAYFGFEDESKPGWKSPVFDRAIALAQEAAILYHLLSLQIHISKHPRLSELFLSGSEIRPITGEMHMEWVSSWRQTKDARKALAHSVAITRTLELALLQRRSKNGFLPSPITAQAFSISRNILRLWCASAEGACTCNSKREHTEIDLNHLGLYRGSELQGWFENGGPPTVRGMPFCKCAGELWFVKLETLV